MVLATGQHSSMNKKVIRAEALILCFSLPR